MSNIYWSKESLDEQVRFLEKAKIYNHYILDEGEKEGHHYWVLGWKVES